VLHWDDHARPSGNGWLLRRTHRNERTGKPSGDDSKIRGLLQPKSATRSAWLRVERSVYLLTSSWGGQSPKTIVEMERLPHGYTNETRRLEDRIEKRYRGFASFARANREFTCLTRLFGRYPVPEVLRFDASLPRIVLGEVGGRQGQDLIDDGQPAMVLCLIGSQLAALQSIDPSVIPGLEGKGDVIVHGDYGPQNILCSLDLTSVSGVLDWELAHLGSPVEDLAWAEWIVRTHHPEAQNDLPELFAGSGLSIDWSERQSSMVQQCLHHIAYCEASGFEASTAEWRRRLHATERWTE
jgi:tRNA A-37 threonylcarbamoyl transferase component Bud32